MDKRYFLIGVLTLIFFNTIIMVPIVKGNWNYSVKSGDFLTYNFIFQNKTIISFYRVNSVNNWTTTQTLINSSEKMISYNLKVKLFVLNITKESIFGNLTVYNGSSTIYHLGNTTIGKKIPDKINSTKYTEIYALLKNNILPKYITLYILGYSWDSINNFYFYTNGVGVLNLKFLDAFQKFYNPLGRSYLINVYRMRFTFTGNVFRSLKNNKQFGINSIEYDDFYWNCLTGILIERYYYYNTKNTVQFGNNTEKETITESSTQIVLTNTNITIPVAIPNYLYVIIISSVIVITIIFITYKRLYKPRQGKNKEIEEYLSKKAKKFKKGV